MIEPQPQDPHKKGIVSWFLSLNPLYVAFVGLAIACLMAWLCLSCAPSLDKVTQTLTVLEQAQIVAIHNFETFEKDYEPELVKQHMSEGKPAVKAEVEKYRAARDKAMALIVQYSKLDADAHQLIPLVQDGKADRATLDQLIAALMKVAADFGIQLKTIGVKL